MRLLPRGTLWLFFLLNWAAPAQSQEFLYDRDYQPMLLRSKTQGDPFYYSNLLSRFLVNDSTLSVIEMMYLMIGYTGTPYFQPYLYRATEKTIKSLNDQRRYKEALMICDTFLTRYPLSQSAIIEKAYAFHQLKQYDSAVHYKEQFARIMAAMDWSADGHSPETAMFAIGPYDGQNFVDMYYHAELGKINTVENQNGDLCSAVEIIFKQKEQVQKTNFYFVIQHAANTLKK